MATIDTSRRLRPAVIGHDIDSFNGLRTIDNYITGRLAATPEALQRSYDTMVAKQQQETEMLARQKAAADAARQAEWDFHNAVLAMKESVRGQFGSDSDQAQAVGYKKKSDRKRPKRGSTKVGASLAIVG
ncbi:MAG: hypothetical protein HC929_09705 [Leptolyngbyaceae cyanobacterium SM2_5_2]|nr:hypothetical protein [Leptolyngbyaceae cyanobacterium SM2_5_2]